MQPQTGYHLSPHYSAYRSIYNSDPQPRRMGEGRELSGKRKDGSEFPLEVSLSNAVINDNLFVVAFVIDISRRKKAEDALKKSEEELILYATELEQRVKKRTEDLDRIIAQLEKTNNKLHKEVSERKKAEEEAQKSLAKEKDLNELKSRFVSMASHEFRTPLSSVLSSVNLITKYLERGNEEKIGKHTDRIRASVKNLTDILNDFLSIGRLEEGKVDLVLERINLYNFIQNIISEIEGTLKEKQKIYFECPEDLETDTDEKVLKHIFFNLISNASKYSDEDDRIDIKVLLDNNNINISFIDYGMGIPEDEQKNLFERFFRAKNAMNI
jgi:signal transduction histidine kinase